MDIRPTAAKAVPAITLNVAGVMKLPLRISLP
jgi:hypothetical protein